MTPPHNLEDLKRLDQDDVKNSEYIEEDVIRSYSFAQRSQLFRNSNVIMSHVGDDPNIIFKFEGGTGGLDSHVRSKSNLNRSQDTNAYERNHSTEAKKVLTTD